MSEGPYWKSADKYAQNYVLNALMNWSEAWEKYSDPVAKQRAYALHAAIMLLSKEASE